MRSSALNAWVGGKFTSEREYRNRKAINGQARGPISNLRGEVCRNGKVLAAAINNTTDQEPTYLQQILRALLPSRGHISSQTTRMRDTRSFMSALQFSYGPPARSATKNTRIPPPPAAEQS